MQNEYYLDVYVKEALSGLSCASVVTERNRIKRALVYLNFFRFRPLAFNLYYLVVLLIFNALLSFMFFSRKNDKVDSAGLKNTIFISGDKLDTANSRSKDINKNFNRVLLQADKSVRPHNVKHTIEKNSSDSSSVSKISVSSSDSADMQVRHFLVMDSVMIKKHILVKDTIRTFIRKKK